MVLVQLLRMRCMLVIISSVLVFLCTRADAQECERLKASLTYTQEEAPRDLSGVLPVVVERINEVLEGVVDVEVEWEGADLHGRVGEHMVRCKVTRLAAVIQRSEEDIQVDTEGRQVVTQCFHVPFSILDTNECALPRGHPMRHKCHESTICVNTIGSYQCVCPRIDGENPSGTVEEQFWHDLSAEGRSAWEVSFNTTGKSSCPSSPSTHSCCTDRAHTKDGTMCRASFRCPVDPCSSATRNDCSPRATCLRSLSPVDDPNYSCQCPPTLMGNGKNCRPGIDPNPEPKVMFDGVTPTEETRKHNLYCDCTAPVLDACSGFPPCKGKHEVCTVFSGNVPKCACKPGYVLHEKYGCVDESPPLLRLKNDVNGDGILRLKQGDVYKEYAVDVQDENAEEYLRSLKIAYSQPLPHGCLTKIGEFHVNYTVATPWTSPPSVVITRRVIIEDIDECSINVAKFEKSCPELVPKCDTEAGAICVNTIGSYTCKCPKYTSGDGFLHGLSFESGGAPEGFKGGNGCHDTSQPVIGLVGPNPKVFRVCECGGISGIMGGKKMGKDAELRSQQQRHYGDDIKELVRATAGAELCASRSNPSPSASDCVNAFDETYKGRVDLSGEVIVGEPVQKGPLQWAVPYDVKDQAGNAAATVWRDVLVEEVDLDEFESLIRREAQKDKKEEIELAVKRAVEVERTDANKKRPLNQPTRICPTCEPCDCSGDCNESACQAVCKARVESCSVDEHSLVIKILLWLESFLPPAVAESMVFLVVLIFVALLLRLFFSLILTQPDYRRARYADEEQERAMQNAVTYYDGNGTPASSTRPPRASRSIGGGDIGSDNLFSPSSASHGRPADGASPFRQEEDDPVDSIYRSPSIITPRNRGEGIRKRSPYNGGDRY